jgi:hypothetical protein
LLSLSENLRWIGFACSSLTFEQISRCSPWRELPAYRTEPRIADWRSIGCSVFAALTRKKQDDLGERRAVSAKLKEGHRRPRPAKAASTNHSLVPASAAVFGKTLGEKTPTMELSSTSFAGCQRIL